LSVEIGKRIKKLRTENGLTQKQLAARIRGCPDYTYIGKIERGEQLPSIKILLKIGEALSVPVSHFFQELNGSTDITPSAPGLKSGVATDHAGDLRKALSELHDDDMPLIVEIIRAVNSQRKPARRHVYGDTGEQALMAAENSPPYRKKRG
jgi:transcriptional regulator with XRE-family HTH domain